MYPTADLFRIPMNKFPLPCFELESDYCFALI